MLTLFLCPQSSQRFGSRLATIFEMAKTKENGVLFCFLQTHLPHFGSIFMWCSFALLPDWSVFLTGLGYKQDNAAHKLLFDKVDPMPAPGELAGLWVELGADSVEKMLREEGIVGANLGKILTGIKELVPKGLLLLVYHPLLCLF